MRATIPSKAPGAEPVFGSARLDQIAEAHDAILFIPTGNTARADLRPEWMADEMKTLVGLAGARNDDLLMPAESVRNVAIPLASSRR